MAPQDYVKRGQPKKRKTKSRNRNTKQATPWFRMFGAILIVVSFAFGLFWLQFKASNRTDPLSVEALTVEAKNAPSASNQSAESIAEKDALPVLREEEWAFIDALPEYSVEVEVEELPESDKDYIMQCGSFRQASQAEELKARIAFEGFESEVVESNGNNGRWYRVVLGPYERKRVAEKDRHQLRRGNILGCKIW